MFASEYAQKRRTIDVLNLATQMFRLISLHENRTDIICKFDRKVAKSLGE